jgi:hypothetical protein
VTATASDESPLSSIECGGRRTSAADNTGDGAVTIGHDPDTDACPGPGAAPAPAVVAAPRFTG